MVFTNKTELNDCLTKVSNRMSGANAEVILFSARLAVQPPPVQLMPFLVQSPGRMKDDSKPDAAQLFNLVNTGGSITEEMPPAEMTGSE